MHEPESPPQTVETPIAPATAAKSARAALLIVFLVVFIDLLGFGIVLPLLPGAMPREFIPRRSERDGARDRHWHLDVENLLGERAAVPLLVRRYGDGSRIASAAGPFFWSA